MFSRLTAIAAVCLTAAVGFSGIASGDDQGAQAPLQPITSITTPSVPVPDTPPIQTPDVAGVNVPDVPAVQTPDVPAVTIPTPGSSSGQSEPAQSTQPASAPSSAPASHSSSTPSPHHSSSSGSSHTQPHHAAVQSAGTKADNAGKPERVTDQIGSGAHHGTAKRSAKKNAARVERMPRLRPTEALNGDSGRLIQVKAVSASSDDSEAPQNGDHGTTAGSIQTAGNGWSAPVMPLLFLGGFGLIAFTLLGNRAYAPSLANRSLSSASDRRDLQTSERGDAEAADSSLGSTVLDVSPGDKVVAPGPPVALAAAVTTTDMPSAAPARDDVHRAAGGDASAADPEPDAIVFTYTVRRRSGGLVGAARKGLRSVRGRR